VPSLHAVNATYRAALERQEAAAVATMLTAYGTAQAALEPSIAALAKQVDGLDKPDAEKLFQLSRYRILENQLDGEMARLTGTLGDRITRDQAAAIALGQESAAQQVRAAFGEQHGEFAADALRLTRLPADQLADLVGMLGPDSPLSASLDRLGPLAAEQVKAGLIRGMVLGQGPRQTARMVQDAFGGNLAHALRYSRTATLYANRTSNIRLYQANDDVIEGWRWNAHLGPRTCAACLALNGKFFELDKPMRSHWNCRCAASPAVKGSQVTLRSGEDWLNGQDATTQQTILGKGGYAAYKAGHARLSDFLGERDDQALGTVFQQRSLRQIVGPKQAKQLASEAAKLPDPWHKFAGRADAEDWASGHWSGFTRSITAEQRTALDNYTGWDHKTINGLLRDRLPIPKKDYDPAVLKQARKDTRVLDGIMNKEIVDRDITAYRVANIPEWAERAESLEGMVIQDKGFVSTSVLRKNTERFEDWAARDNGVPIIMEIRVPKGSRGAYLEGYAQQKFGDSYDELPDELKEAELLLPRDSRFMITNTRRESGTVHLVMELLT